MKTKLHAAETQNLTVLRVFLSDMNWRHALRFMTTVFAIGMLLAVFGACSRGEETKTPAPTTNPVSTPHKLHAGYPQRSICANDFRND